MASEKEQQQSQLKLLITLGKEQGYLTYAEVNDHLPDSITDTDQVEDIIGIGNRIRQVVVHTCRIRLPIPSRSKTSSR